MPSTSGESLLALLDRANTPDEVKAVERLIEDKCNGYAVATLAEVADFFGTSEGNVRQWRLRTPPMPGEPGAWPLRDITRWRCEWLAQSDLSAAKRQQDYELGQIQVEQKRIELAREKKQVLDRDDVELWAATALVELREGIMQLPEMLAASAPTELKDFVRAESDRQCRDVLIATAKRLEATEISKEYTAE